MHDENDYITDCCEGVLVEERKAKIAKPKQHPKEGLFKEGSQFQSKMGFHLN